jgi:hypothetical protein
MFVVLPEDDDDEDHNDAAENDESEHQENDQGFELVLAVRVATDTRLARTATRDAVFVRDTGRSVRPQRGQSLQ